MFYEQRITVKNSVPISHGLPISVIYDELLSLLLSELRKGYLARPYIPSNAEEFEPSPVVEQKVKSKSKKVLLL